MTQRSDSGTRRLRLAEIPATPWKNGGGVTREIATGGGAGGDWGWRVSLAEVAEDGPFSIFPETDRVIAVIEGAGMDLHRPDGSSLALELFQPLRFAGEDPFEGRLRDGPVRDLNVMVRRGRFAAEMEIVPEPSSCDAASEPGDALVILCLAGGCEVAAPDSAAQQLAEGDVLIHEGSGRFTLQVAEGSRVAVLQIRRLATA